MGTSVIGAIVANIKANTVGFTTGVETAKKSARQFGTDVQALGGVHLTSLQGHLGNVSAVMRTAAMTTGLIRVGFAAAAGDAKAFGEAMQALPGRIGMASTAILGLINEVMGYRRAIEAINADVAQMRGAGAGRDVGVGMAQKTALIGKEGFDRERLLLQQEMSGLYAKTGDNEWAWGQAQEYEFARYRDISRREEEARRADATAAFTRRQQATQENSRKIVDQLEAEEKAMAEIQWRIWSDAEDYGITLQEAAFAAQMAEAAEADAEVKDLLRRRAEIEAGPEGRLNVGMGALVTDRMQRSALAGDSARTLSQEQLAELRQINRRLDKLLTATEEAAGLG